MITNMGEEFMPDCMAVSEYHCFKEVCKSLDIKEAPSYVIAGYYIEEFPYNPVKAARNNELDLDIELVIDVISWIECNLSNE